MVLNECSGAKSFISPTVNNECLENNCDNRDPCVSNAISPNPHSPNCDNLVSGVFNVNSPNPHFDSPNCDKHDAISESDEVAASHGGGNRAQTDSHPITHDSHCNVNNSSRDSSQANDSHNQNNHISAPEKDTVDADISRGTGRHASRDDNHTEHDSRCDVNPDCQQGQFQDGNSHNNDVVSDSDTAGRVAKIEFSDPKVHENTLRIKIGHLNSVALIDTGATLSIISESLLDKLNPRNVKYVKPTVSVVYGVGSQQHEITTKIEADFFIDGHKSGFPCDEKSISSHSGS